MQYQVPQFIETEDKIVGPLTIKQFLYLAVGFLASFLSFFVLKFIVWLLLTILIAVVAMSFAFIKYNGRSFLTLISSLFGYLWKPRVYVRKEEGGVLPGGKLKNLDLKLKTSQQPVKGEKGFKFSFLKPFSKVKEKYEVYKKNTGEREAARRVDYK